MLAWPKVTPKSPRNFIVINLESVIQEDGYINISEIGVAVQINLY